MFLPSDGISFSCFSQPQGLFAIGNMALSLKEEDKGQDTIFPLLSQLNKSFSSACACLDNKDEKVRHCYCFITVFVHELIFPSPPCVFQVVVNAIRAIGHLSYFIYSSKFFTMSEPCISTKLNLYKNSLSSLTLKVKRALDDATEGLSSCLTWSQRNNAKKQAWGSCSTIGILLTYSPVLPSRDAIDIDIVLIEQFRCLQLSNAIHDKIAAAAAHSLANLPYSFWLSLPEDCDSIGRGIACCLHHLGQVNVS
jgi:hypothetical protein